MRLKRVQFYMDEKEYREMLKHCQEKSRDPGNLALYSLRRYMQQYPLKKGRGISIPKKRK